MDNVEKGEHPGLVFISYSHEDKSWCDRIKTQLKAFMNASPPLTQIWDDGRIEPGTEWETAIDDAMKQASVGVMLVTPNFLASDFIVQKEVPYLVDAARRNAVRLVWIPVSYSNYGVLPIAAFQAASDPRQPLDSLAQWEADRELVRIAEFIYSAAINRGRANGSA
jgi:hypothetical protein